MVIHEKKEIAMSFNMGDWFFRHMDRLSESAANISNDGEVSSFKMLTWLLEASLWEYIRKARKLNYIEDVEGYEDLKKDRLALNNKLTQRKLGDQAISDKKARLDIQESLLRIKGLMSFAVDQGIAPGYKPPEKRIGIKIGENIRKKMERENGGE